VHFMGNRRCSRCMDIAKTARYPRRYRRFIAKKLTVLKLPYRSCRSWWPCAAFASMRRTFYFCIINWTNSLSVKGVSALVIPFS
jgi:hypothetical protein